MRTTPRGGWWLLTAAVLGLLLVKLRGAFGPWIALHRWLDAHGVPAPVRNLDGALILVGLPVAVALVGAGGRPGRALRSLGLLESFTVALRFTVLAVLPMFAVAAATGWPPRLEESLVDRGMLGPLREELYFRGLMVLLVLRAGGIGFWTAAVISGLAFGLAHVSIVSGPGWQAAPIVLITGAGGVFYAWLLRRWAWNLWVPILLHAGMNLAWALFEVQGGAVGPWLPNLGRAATIALAVWLTLRQTSSPSQERRVRRRLA